MIKGYKRKIIMIKNGVRFIREIALLCFVYTIAYFIYDDYIKNVKFTEGILNTFFMLYAYRRFTLLLKKYRQTADEGEYELKGWYMMYIFFLLLIICCTYNSDILKSVFLSTNLDKYRILKKYSIDWVLLCVYKSIQIIQNSIEVALVKDIVFEINGWNIRQTLESYWNELIENKKIYMLHEDKNKRNPRLWLIRGGACKDIIDCTSEAMIYHSLKEYIVLTDTQTKEVLRRRRIDDNDKCCYEGDSVFILTPWEIEHFYEVSFFMIDLDYYEEDKIEELIQKNRDRILILPSDIKSKERKMVKKIISYKNMLERTIAGWIK
jgi:hypothetical protein|nr:MAG: hypothetical protein D8H95_37960 [Lachnospiraceae bacterium]